MTKDKKIQILKAVLPHFGKFGFKRNTIEDLAKSAGISKQGLYLHFSSKEELFAESFKYYLNQNIDDFKVALTNPELCLLEKLHLAMDIWFGRHKRVFVNGTLDLVETGNLISPFHIQTTRQEFILHVSTCLKSSSEYCQQSNKCNPEEIAEILFQFGLTWKEPDISQEQLSSSFKICIQACCQLTTKENNL